MVGDEKPNGETRHDDDDVTPRDVIDLPRDVTVPRDEEAAGEEEEEEEDEFDEVTVCCCEVCSINISKLFCL